MWLVGWGPCPKPLPVQQLPGEPTSLPRRYEVSKRRELPGQLAGSRDTLGEVLSPLPTQVVCHVLLGRDGQAQGVALQDGTEVRSKLVLSSASPQITFLDLIPQVRGAQGWRGFGVVASSWIHCPLTAGLCSGISHLRSSCQRI